MWSAVFNEPVANSIVVSGLGHAESGIYFGYNGTVFGILHVEEAIREIRTLTIATKSSTAENVTVTLNNVTASVPVTNGASTATTAYEISQGNFAGWTANQLGNTVIFLSNEAGAKNNTFSLVGSTVSGSFARTLAGATGIQTWYPQSTWNIDKLDGSGSSGFTLNPQNGNVYRANVAFGFGAIVFEVLTTVPSGTVGRPRFTKVHSINSPNTRTTPSLFNPSFPFTIAAYSAGSTANLAVKTADYYMYTTGEKRLLGNRYTVWNSNTSVTNTGYTPIFTIRADGTFNGRASQQVLELFGMNCAMKHTQPGIVFLLRNATLTGANFSQFVSGSTSMSVDTNATAASIADNTQIIFSLPLAETGNEAYIFKDELTLQPNETLTLAGRTVTGTAAYMIGSINLRDEP